MLVGSPFPLLFCSHFRRRRFPLLIRRSMLGSIPPPSSSFLFLLFLLFFSPVHCVGVLLLQCRRCLSRKRGSCGWVGRGPSPVGPHAAAVREEGGGGGRHTRRRRSLFLLSLPIRKSPFRSRGRSSSPPLPLSSSAALVRDSSFLKKTFPKNCLY